MSEQAGNEAATATTTITTRIGGTEPPQLVSARSEEVSVAECGKQASWEPRWEVGARMRDDLGTSPPWILCRSDDVWPGKQPSGKRERVQEEVVQQVEAQPAI
jgi:hypothetical protein